ncbi:hypothetical protein JOD43_001384 [Pullulanibacillus pueri]|uniref:Uncharacterized protein n=1 Tax=Pullulanibacillus pueri TaxID=1437324 RepID=A0A8J2ZUG5_9BACL|nr:hypothetical protein [Pullulanibacillus pueri]GGH77999.1 hypothetical protein GCM10007096_10730 [Pullulanibacillus pueri]
MKLQLTKWDIIKIYEKEECGCTSYEEFVYKTIKRAEAGQRTLFIRPFNGVNTYSK